MVTSVRQLMVTYSVVTGSTITQSVVTSGQRQKQSVARKVGGTTSTTHVVGCLDVWARAGVGHSRRRHYCYGQSLTTPLTPLTPHLQSVAVMCCPRGSTDRRTRRPTSGAPCRPLPLPLHPLPRFCNHWLEVILDCVSFILLSIIITYA